MKNLRVLFCTIILGLVYTTINAQDVNIADASEGIQKIAKHNASKWQKSLMLSVGQTKMMTERNIEFEMKKNAVYTSDTDMDTKNADLTKIQAEFQEKVHEIMTPEQYEKYLAEIKEISGK